MKKSTKFSHLQQGSKKLPVIELNNICYPKNPGVLYSLG